MWNGLRTANPWQKICSIPPNVSSMTLRVGFVGDQRHSILSPEICSITCGGLFILITLSFPLGFRSFSLPIFISYNVFTADWQKSLLLSLLLWASLGYWGGVDFCRRRIMAEYGWKKRELLLASLSLYLIPLLRFFHLCCCCCCNTVIHHCNNQCWWLLSVP